jgi:hypothetical protein
MLGTACTKLRRMILMSEYLSTAKCRRVHCDHLPPARIETIRGPRISWYCDVTRKGPGNMKVCPLGLIQ